uniref:Uncharacterized protein n=1 Tax=Spironucleus salmonicida TaxID=348837 RepID=V6LBF7_9EUKA|eukprot:EST41742.1 Hypothetical protein SS50377_18828 [Spironucleus salmonicida]
MDCNVPSLVVFALFFIISLGLLIHMCLLFSMIGDQSTLVVDDLIVDTSLLVHMNGVQSAIQFHSQQQPQLSIITESIQTDIAQSNTATVDTEFSSSNFALATKTLQTARTSFIVVNNGRLAATEYHLPNSQPDLRHPQRLLTRNFLTLLHSKQPILVHLR